MPRAKQPGSRRVVAGFRVTSQEYQKLQATAQNQGLSLSDLLRLTVLGQTGVGQQQA
jgi:hypothetical protein